MLIRSLFCVLVLSCVPALAYSPDISKQDVTARPAELTAVLQAGSASWYGPGFHGRKTANGERYDQHGITAAHRTLKLGTKVRVTHGTKSVVVRINDRGPYAKGRIIDLSKGAAERVGLIDSGHGRVTLTLAD